MHKHVSRSIRRVHDNISPPVYIHGVDISRIIYEARGTYNKTCKCEAAAVEIAAVVIIFIILHFIQVNEIEGISHYYSTV